MSDVRKPKPSLKPKSATSRPTPDATPQATSLSRETSTEALELGAVQRQAEELARIEDLVRRWSGLAAMGLGTMLAELHSEADRIRRKSVAAAAFQRIEAGE